jgi:16S rRNA (guanine527-N7)-methyltransferase
MNEPTPPDSAPPPEPEISEWEFIGRVMKAIEPFAPERPILLAQHAWMVREKNKVMNLTRITDPEGMATKHILDSLVATPILQGTEDVSIHRVLDLGTGAGWPGLALAIANPEIELTLLDGTKKKVDFLQEVVKKLGLAGQVTCVWSRFEDYIRAERHSTDLVLARAVGPLREILEWCTNRWFGHILLWKGPRFDEELTEAADLMRDRRLELVLDEHYQLPGDDAARRLVMIGAG